MCVKTLTDPQLLARTMYWNIERARLLELRLPLQWQIRDLELYFAGEFGQSMTVLDHEEHGEKWVLCQRRYRSDISIDGLTERLSVLGASEDTIGLIDTARTTVRLGGNSLLFYTDRDVFEDDDLPAAFEVYPRELPAAVKRYHTLRKDIVPIKNALLEATSYCTQSSQQLENRYQQAPPSTIWRYGPHFLRFARKSSPLTFHQEQNWLVEHGVSQKDLGNWHKCRGWRRTVSRYDELQYWKDGVECTEHWYQGSRF
jgi:hypothetical protein